MPSFAADTDGHSVSNQTDPTRGKPLDNHTTLSVLTYVARDLADNGRPELATVVSRIASQFRPRARCIHEFDDGAESADGHWWCSGGCVATAKDREIEDYLRLCLDDDDPYMLEMYYAELSDMVTEFYLRYPSSSMYPQVCEAAGVLKERLRVRNDAWRAGLNHNSSA